MLNFSKTQVFPWVKFLLVCLFIVVSIASCYNRVADILRSQQDYTNKVVTIEGVVTESLSIAGIGAKKTGVQIIASPDYKRNMHEIYIESKAGNIRTICQNIPFADNTKTSYLAALSAMSVLKGIFEPIKIGS